MSLDSRTACSPTHSREASAPIYGGEISGKFTVPSHAQAVPHVRPHHDGVERARGVWSSTPIHPASSFSTPDIQGDPNGVVTVTGDTGRLSPPGATGAVAGPRGAGTRMGGRRRASMPARRSRTGSGTDTDLSLPFSSVLDLSQPEREVQRDGIFPCTRSAFLGIGGALLMRGVR